MSIIDALSALKAEQQRIEGQIKQLNAAIASLGGASKALTHSSGGKRRISAAGRTRIAAAQRARWARVKAAKEKR